MKNLFICICQSCFYLLFYNTLFAQNGVIYSNDHGGLMTHDQKMSCVCNDPQIRNAFIPNILTTNKIIRIRFVVMQKSSNNQAVQINVVQDAISTLNLYFNPHKIYFQPTIEFVTSSKYFKIKVNEINDLKNNYPRNNDTELAIYVVKKFNGLGVGGTFTQSTFPWQGSQTAKTATTTLGGIIFESEIFILSENVVHEVGHALGLYHTHHGTGEMKCDTDPLDVENVGSNNDDRGDFCSDTEPFPVVLPSVAVCSDADINDISTPKIDCNGVTLPLTAKTNHMSYTGVNCRQIFTQQQAGRMHCFLTHYSIAGWLTVCPADWVLLNQTITQNQNYAVSNIIEAGPDFVISNGIDVESTAGNKIVLKTGFVAQEGSHFVAEIAACPPMRFNEDNSSYLYPEVTTPNISNSSFMVISPSPTTGKFHVKIGDDSDEWIDMNYNLEIYTILGEKIYFISNTNLQTSNEIDISGKPKGIYFIKIQNEENVYIEKVILQ